MAELLREDVGVSLRQHVCAAACILVASRLHWAAAAPPASLMEVVLLDNGLPFALMCAPCVSLSATLDAFDHPEACEDDSYAAALSTLALCFRDARMSPNILAPAVAAAAIHIWDADRNQEWALKLCADALDVLCTADGNRHRSLMLRNIVLPPIFALVAANEKVNKAVKPRLCVKHFGADCPAATCALYVAADWLALIASSSAEAASDEETPCSKAAPKFVMKPFMPSDDEMLTPDVASNLRLLCGTMAWVMRLEMKAIRVPSLFNASVRDDWLRAPASHVLAEEVKDSRISWVSRALPLAMSPLFVSQLEDLLQLARALDVEEAWLQARMALAYAQSGQDTSAWDIWSALEDPSSITEDLYNMCVRRVHKLSLSNPSLVARAAPETAAAIQAPPPLGVTDVPEDHMSGSDVTDWLRGIAESSDNTDLKSRCSKLLKAVEAK